MSDRSDYYDAESAAWLDPVTPGDVQPPPTLHLLSDDNLALCKCGYVHPVDPTCQRTGHRSWCNWLLTDLDGVEREPCDCGELDPDPKPGETATLGEQLLYSVVLQLSRDVIELKKQVKELSYRQSA